MVKERHTETTPLTDKEGQFLQEFIQARVLHWFQRGPAHVGALVEVAPIAFLPHWNRGKFKARLLTAEELGLCEQRYTLTTPLAAEDLKILEHARFSPRQSSFSAIGLLSLAIRAGLATNDQLREIFENPPGGFDILKWSENPNSEWPEIKGNGEGLSKLAGILGKDGIQRYAWDGGYGDISESWRTVFISKDGELHREGTQTYGGMFA